MRLLRRIRHLPAHHCATPGRRSASTTATLRQRERTGNIPFRDGAPWTSAPLRKRSGWQNLPSFRVKSAALFHSHFWRSGSNTDPSSLPILQIRVGQLPRRYTPISFHLGIVSWFGCLAVRKLAITHFPLISSNLRL